MLVAVEVAKPEHVVVCLKYDIDILWIGARTSANPFAMQDVADSLKGIDVPVFVKNPVNPDWSCDWRPGAHQPGWHQAPGCHPPRFLKLRQENLPQPAMWQIPMELHRRIPQPGHHLRPQHIGGRRELVAPLCQQAMDLGSTDLIVESHCSPDEAWSVMRVKQHTRTCSTTSSACWWCARSRRPLRASRCYAINRRVRQPAAGVCWPSA